MEFNDLFLKILKDESIDKISFEDYGDIVLCTILDVFGNELGGSDSLPVKALEKSYQNYQDWRKERCLIFPIGKCVFGK